MSIIEGIFNILAPYECLCCKKEGSLLCWMCADVLTSVPPRCYRCKRREVEYRTCQRCRRYSPLFSVRPVTIYDDPVAKELVRVLKFERAKGAATAMAVAMAAALDALGGVHITHVPTANSRVRERGYDQAALLAKELARRNGQVYTPLLARMGVQRQLGQDRKVRIKQMDEAFRVLNPDLVRGRHILLVDDVLTTGATCEAAARTLRHAGAKRVSALVFAVA
jgi:ComF family protein